MKQAFDKFARVILILLGIALIFSGGSCIIGTGLNLLALFSVTSIGLGVWIISLGMEKEPSDDNEGENPAKDNP